MKKSVKPLFLALFILFFITLEQISVAQPLPPTDKGGIENRMPGSNSAPIDGGLIISLAMVAGFGGWKLFRALQRKKQAAGN